MTSHYWWTTPTSLLDRYKSSSQKQMPKKNNQHKRNYLLTSKQQNTVSKVPIQHGEQTKKNGKRIWNWYFIYQFHRRPFMSLNWYPVCLQNDHKQTKNGDSHAIRRQTIQIWRNMRHVPPFCPYKTKSQKFLHDTRETSPLTALFFSQFVLSSCLRTAHTERLCC